MAGPLEFIIGLIGFLLLLTCLGLMADSAERRDAERRNRGR